MTKQENSITSQAPLQQQVNAMTLRYVGDAEPGFHRRRCGRGFVYLDTAGKPVREPEMRARCKALMIPPAWQEVWISPDPRGHIQATGRDQAGRKQYIYHPEWTQIREQNKFERLLAFGEALPALRAQVDADLRGRPLNREKVIALIIRLLESTLIRIGNREYARQNDSYGLTTLLDDHVEIDRADVLFEFRGKSGKEHEIALHNRRLARLVQACQELPGQRLFQYVDESGNTHAIDSGDVNDYLRAVTGSDFTAKEFRTWGGTVKAVELLRACAPKGASERECTRQLNAALKKVAAGLGNTVAVCRQHYVHPAVVDAFRSEALGQYVYDAIQRQVEDAYALDGDEAVVLEILRTVQRKRKA